MATKKSPTIKRANNVGSAVFIRTVTYHYTGRVVRETDTEIELDDAAWIADSGRFCQALITGQFSEVEPYPSGMTVSVLKGAIVDIVRNWPHPLPRDVK